MNDGKSRVLPWTKSCFVCGEDNEHGLQLKSMVKDDGTVIINYTPRECDKGWKHIMHGGIAMTLLDEVMTWAAMLDVKFACVSVEITTRMRRPISVGCPIIVSGKVDSSKSRMINTSAKITDREGVILATAVGKYMKMPADKVALCKDDFVWDDNTVLPDEIINYL